MYNKIIINCNSLKNPDTSLDDACMCGALRVFVLNSLHATGHFIGVYVTLPRGLRDGKFIYWQ